ncbi:MAG: hypothetical protein KAS15_05535 [Nanoarchaeota archaeon]|nr:hypothetical protein [Nanoarchaeota archaeon]
MKEELRRYGLSEKEIGVYLSLLKLGNATTNRISEITDIRRSTVYEVLESLKKKGLVGGFQKHKKQYFNAAKPSVLIDLLHDKENMIKTILPDMNKLSQLICEKPRVEVFAGISGIKTASEDMLNYKEILIYGATTLADNLLGHYNANFAERRTKKKIMLKAVIAKDVPDHMLKTNVRRYTKIRTLQFFKGHNSVYFIYGSKVMIMTLGEELMIMRVTSSLLVESQRIIFNFLWDLGKEIG